MDSEGSDQTGQLLNASLSCMYISVCFFWHWPFYMKYVQFVSYYVYFSDCMNAKILKTLVFVLCLMSHHSYS